jgi:hypothetical protein
MWWFEVDEAVDRRLMPQLFQSTRSANAIVSCIRAVVRCATPQVTSGVKITHWIIPPSSDSDIDMTTVFEDTTLCCTCMDARVSLPTACYTNDVK